jgi:hypothetical protein
MSEWVDNSGVSVLVEMSEENQPVLVASAFMGVLNIRIDTVGLTPEAQRRVVEAMVGAARATIPCHLAAPGGVL